MTDTNWSPGFNEVELHKSVVYYRLLFVQHNLTQLARRASTLSPLPPTKKVFGFAIITWVPFLKVGGFEPTQTHPWPRHWSYHRLYIIDHRTMFHGSFCGIFVLNISTKIHSEYYNCLGDIIVHSQLMALYKTIDIWLYLISFSRFCIVSYVETQFIYTNRDGCSETPREVNKYLFTMISPDPHLSSKLKTRLPLAALENSWWQRGWHLDEGSGSTALRRPSPSESSAIDSICWADQRIENSKDNLNQQSVV